MCLEDQIQARNVNGLIIDIEGGEIDLFMHASLTSVNKMILELHPALTGQDEADALMDKLVQDGFVVDSILSDGQFKLLRRV